MQSSRKHVAETFVMVLLAASCFVSRITACETDCNTQHCEAFDLPGEAVEHCGDCDSQNSFCNPEADDYNNLRLWCTHFDCSGNESRCGHELCISPTLLSASQETCESYGLDNASSADECQTLADLYNETYSGEAGGDVLGCVRLRSPNDAVGGWQYSSTENGGMCSGSVQTSGYECLCKNKTYSNVDESMEGDGDMTSKGAGDCSSSFSATFHWGFQSETSCNIHQDTEYESVDACCDNSTLNHGAESTDHGAYDSLFTCLRSGNSVTILKDGNGDDYPDLYGGLMADSNNTCNDPTSCFYSPFHAIYSVWECPMTKTTAMPTTPTMTTAPPTTAAPVTTAPTTVAPATTTVVPTTTTAVPKTTVTTPTPDTGCGDIQQSRVDECVAHYACEVVDKGGDPPTELECDDCSTLPDVLACVPPCFCDRHIQELKSVFASCPTVKDTEYACNINYTSHVFQNIRRSGPSASPGPSSGGDDFAFDMSLFLANGRRPAVALFAVGAGMVAAILTLA